MNANTNDAVDTLHTMNTRTATYFTKWANTQAEALRFEDTFRSWGCEFTRVFAEPKSCLGAFRVVGHKATGAL